MTMKQASVGLMLDIETLGTGPNAIAWQTALYGWNLLNPTELLSHPHHAYLPIQPQMDMIPARMPTAATFLYWLKQASENPDSVKDFALCDGTDFDELVSFVRHFLRAFDRMTDGVDYELWTRGNFDVPIMESLIRQCGFAVPWDFRALRDLRTLEAVSGVSYKDVPEPTGFIKHRADWDCKFQIAHHTACMDAMRKG